MFPVLLCCFRSFFEVVVKNHIYCVFVMFSYGFAAIAFQNGFCYVFVMFFAMFCYHDILNKALYSSPWTNHFTHAFFPITFSKHFIQALFASTLSKHFIMCFLCFCYAFLWICCHCFSERVPHQPRWTECFLICSCKINKQT